MKVVIGIPARMGSTRFPGKPLCKILNKSMIEHCYKRSSLSKYSTNLFIATCDEEIKNHSNSFGAKVIMTDKNIQRPGLRVAEAAKQLNLHDEDIVVVVQGDEPLIHPDMIDNAIEPLIKEKDIYVSNNCKPIISESEWRDPGEIKVVCDLKMNAMYFSRSPIPSVDHQEIKTTWWKQVCIMPFRWHFMKKFNQLNPTPLELQESIEMIRALQYGYKVRMVPTQHVVKSVDNDYDRQMVEKIMTSDDLYEEYKNE